MVLMDLARLSSNRLVEPILLESAIWLLPPLKEWCKTRGIAVKHFTMRNEENSPGVRRYFTTEPSRSAVAQADFALLYTRPEYDYTRVQDLLLESDKDWLERDLQEVERNMDHQLRRTEMENHWFHALDKVSRTMVRGPNIGLQTRMIIDLRPPRNPND